MPLTSGQYAREKADTLSCINLAIDALGGCGTVDVFLVTWRWQITPYVHRYPSPVGRLGHTPCQAPDFLRSNSECYKCGQGFAQNPVSGATGWNPGTLLAVSPFEALTLKGADIWHSTSSHPPAFLRSARSSGFRPAATRSANKPCSAARQGSGLQSRPAVILQPAQLSAARPMSPIARPIRNAADRSARPKPLQISTVRTARPDGLFYAIAAGSLPGQEKTDGKGQTCSTRS